MESGRSQTAPVDSDDRAALYRAYTREVAGERMVRNLRAGVFVVSGLNSFFILLDHWVFPAQFWSLLLIRLGINAAMAFLYWQIDRFPALQSPAFGCYFTGFGLVAVIGVAGGVTSTYAPGVTLLFLGMPVLLPLNMRQAATIVGPIFAAFAALPLFTGVDLEWGRYAVHLVFPLATAIECMASCSMLDGMRLAEFIQRRELERARDELRELDKAKSRFTANIHHELRTPLTLILSPLDALRSGEFGELPGSVRNVMGTMQKNGYRLLALINNLLDLAKIENKQLEIQRRAVDLGSIVGDLVESARPLAERKGVVLSAEGFETLPSWNADPAALEKVLMNLVGNALKFTDSGGSIRIVAEPGEQQDLHLRVVDTGIGIPPDQVDRVFGRFAQVDGSATRRHEGTGIGLSLARELVELHGGRIWAESAGEGQGATMHVSLPRGEVDVEEDEETLRDDEGRGISLGNAMQAVEGELALDPEEDKGGGASPRALAELERSVSRWEGNRPVHVDPSESLPRHDASTPEILIAEDNRDMRELLVFLLGREYRVRATRNGREALESLRRAPADLVLTDVMMPEMSGTELCREIKADPATRAIPVVLVTSKAEREMKIEGLELGADDYVTKPFHHRELLARIGSLVRQHRLAAELAEQNSALERALEDLRQAEGMLIQSERLAAVGELAAGIAHEVNNPVNFATNALRALRTSLEDVSGLIEMVGVLDWGNLDKLSSQLEEFQAARDDLDVASLSATLGELIEIASDGLDRTSQLVSDLRDFAAPGRGDRTHVDLRQGVETTVQLLRAQLADAGAQVRIAIPHDLPTVHADPGALNQVFLNLLKNAAEALDGRGGEICVRASADERDVQLLHLQFEDDGTGIPPEVMDKLFQPFFTTKEAGRGTGLGLSMSRQIARAHGGDLSVESRVGAGTTFTLTLPIDDGGRRSDAA